MKRTYQIYQVKSGSFAILNYSYIIVDNTSKLAAIVDPAWDLAKISKILEELKVTLTAILLTHSHFDHTNLVNPLLKRYNPKVYIAAKEIAYYNFFCSNLNPVQDMEIVKLGETQITCILTPGHTVGGICYLLSDCMFTGDTIFIEGCGMCTTNGGDPEKMYESFQKISTIVHPDTLIFPGHSYGKHPGEPFSNLLKNNIYFQIDNKDYFVQFRMRKNQRGLFNFC